MYLNAEDLTGVSPSIESIFKMLSKIIDNLEPHPPTSP